MRLINLIFIAREHLIKKFNEDLKRSMLIMCKVTSSKSELYFIIIIIINLLFYLILKYCKYYFC
jgi:hypothetical protein